MASTKQTSTDLNKIDELEELKCIQANDLEENRKIGENYNNNNLMLRKGEPLNGACNHNNTSRKSESDDGGKVRSMSSSSASSITGSNCPNGGNEDDDEKFYDAAEVNDLNINVNGQGSAKATSRVMAAAMSSRGDSECFEDDEDDDEEKLRFFDTKTSRHASEISESSVLAQLSPRNMKSISVFEENEIDDTTQTKTIASYVASVDLSSLPCKPCEPVKSNQIENTTAQDTNSNKNEYCNNNSQHDEDEDETDAELETAWSFWIDKCYKGTTQDEYEAGLKLIHTVKTVQTFWSVFNNIPDVSQLPNRYSYHLMRNMRKPVWEDSENSSGGLWKFKCKKEDTSLVWREALLAAIGEQFSDWVSRSDDVIGVSVGRREKEDIVQIWNLDFKCEPQAEVCKKFKELVPDVKFSAVFYKPNSSYEVYPPEHSKNLNHNNTKPYVQLNNVNYNFNQSYQYSNGINSTNGKTYNNNYYNNKHQKPK